ncbi:hypothetical protein [Halomonas sp. N3-2A]|uniref:hypothetical protein n=1 Tax=Halomonas sp. N3-2A TaxID=2014541 RepID=UPI001E558543|nr:hypothetical protein [Halomonas sp. N3-2A]
MPLSCHDCNQEKDGQPLADFFTLSKGLRRRLKKQGHTSNAWLERVQRQQQRPLRDASAGD